MFRTLMIAGAAVAALTATSVLVQDRAEAATRHHHVWRHHMSRAATVYGEEASAVAPDETLNPYGGPSLIASRPVPDTPQNRERYGEPLSRGGRVTAPIGD